MKTRVHTIPVHAGYTPQTAWEAILDHSGVPYYDTQQGIFPDCEPANGWANVLVHFGGGEGEDPEDITWEVVDPDLRNRIQEIKQRYAGLLDRLAEDDRKAAIGRKVITEDAEALELLRLHDHAEGLEFLDRHRHDHEDQDPPQ